LGWEHWIIFFLEAIIKQARKNAEKANQVLELHRVMREKMPVITKSPYAMMVLDALFISPIFRPPDFINLTGIDHNSAHRILGKLKDSMILEVIQKHAGQKPDVLVFRNLYELVRWIFFMTHRTI
jgi:Fic family protein